MPFWSFSKYVGKAEKKTKAENKLARLKKNQDLRPVIIEGSVIARTWWGKAWNKNLESYAKEKTFKKSGAKEDGCQTKGEGNSGESREQADRVRKEEVKGLRGQMIHHNTNA